MATFRRARRCKQANAFTRLPLIHESRHLGVVNIPDLHMTIDQNWVISCLSAGVPQLLLLRSAEIRHNPGLCRVAQKHTVAAKQGGVQGKQELSASSTTSINPGSQCWPARGGREREKSDAFSWLNELWWCRKQLSPAHPAAVAINHCRTIGTRLCCCTVIKIDGRAPGFSARARLRPNYAESWRKPRWARLRRLYGAIHYLCRRTSPHPPRLLARGRNFTICCGCFFAETLQTQTCFTLMLRAKLLVPHCDYSAWVCTS